MTGLEKTKCSGKRGCKLVRRGPYGPGAVENLQDVVDMEDDTLYSEDDDDDEYEPDSDDESDDDSVNQDDDIDSRKDQSMADMPEASCGSETRPILFRASGPQREFDKQFLPLTASKLMPKTKTKKRRKIGDNFEFDRDLLIPDYANMFEHIAGQECQHREGYNGWKISVDEMRGCHTVQCIARKDQGWRPQRDSLGFEVAGRCFLTGLAENMPLSGQNVMFHPTRHHLGSIGYFFLSPFVSQSGWFTLFYYLSLVGSG